jgi:hypothetical protein
MNAAEYHQEIFTAQFDAICHKWVERLNLENWSIKYQVADVVGNDGSTEAQVHVNTQLGHQATITFAARMGFEDDKDRENLVVHELLHIILDELGAFAFQNMAEQHHEYFTRLMEIAVSDLARAMVEINA